MNVIIERFALYDVGTLDEIGSVLFVRVSRDDAGGEQSTDNGPLAASLLLLLCVLSRSVHCVFLRCCCHVRAHSFGESRTARNTKSVWCNQDRREGRQRGKFPLAPNYGEPQILKKKNIFNALSVGYMFYFMHTYNCIKIVLKISKHILRLMITILVQNLHNKKTNIFINFFFLILFSTNLTNFTVYNRPLAPIMFKWSDYLLKFCANLGGALSKYLLYTSKILSAALHVTFKSAFLKMSYSSLLDKVESSQRKIFFMK